MFSWKITTRCLIGVAVELGGSACTDGEAVAGLIESSASTMAPTIGSARRLKCIVLLLHLERAGTYSPGLHTPGLVRQCSRREKRNGGLSNGFDRTNG